MVEEVDLPSFDSYDDTSTLNNKYKHISKQKNLTLLKGLLLGVHWAFSDSENYIDDLQPAAAAIQPPLAGAAFSPVNIINYLRCNLIPFFEFILMEEDKKRICGKVAKCTMTKCDGTVPHMKS